MTTSPRSAVLLWLGLVGFLMVLLGQVSATPPEVCTDLPILTPTLEPPVLQLPMPARQAPAVAHEPTADPPTPVVALRVRVPVSASAGQELEYRICVENCSTAAAHHVTVRNPLPANARFVRASPEPSALDPVLEWRLGTLEGGAKQNIVLVLTPTGPDDVKSCTRVQFEHGQCVTTKINRPALRLLKSGPTQAVLYDTLTYKLTVTNTGTADATNVQLIDLPPAGLELATGKDRFTGIVDKLKPGESRSVEYQVIAKKAGRLCNKAIATSGALREEVEHCVTVTEAKLGLNMTGPKQRYLNMPAAYQITVTNPGSAPLSNVVVTNPVPAQTTLVRASAGSQISGNQIQWKVGALEPGASRTLDVVLQAQGGGRICNRATAVADRGLTQQQEVCTEFTGVPAVSLDVEDTEDPVEVGAATVYVINVHNQGTSPVTDVRIVATVPAELEVTQATGATAHRQQGQKVSFEPLTLPAGGDARYRIEVKALRAGDLRFRVELTAEQLKAGPVQQEESTTVYTALPSSRRKPANGVHSGRSAALP
jgi:uncharacterized repeat protein (TIGR01451 family)